MIEMLAMRANPRELTGRDTGEKLLFNMISGGVKVMDKLTSEFFFDQVSLPIIFGEARLILRLVRAYRQPVNENNQNLEPDPLQAKILAAE